MPSTLSSAATKCISDVPGLPKQTSTPDPTSVRNRLSAPFMFVPLRPQTIPSQLRFVGPVCQTKALSPVAALSRSEATRMKCIRSTLHPHHEVEDAARKARVRRLHEGLHRRYPALLEHGPKL